MAQPPACTDRRHNPSPEARAKQSAPLRSGSRSIMVREVRQTIGLATSHWHPPVSTPSSPHRRVKSSD